MSTFNEYYIDLTDKKCIALRDRHILIKDRSGSYCQGRALNPIETVLVNEIAALRAESAGRLDALNSWAKLWSHICTVTGCEDYLPSESNFDAMIDKAQAEHISALEAAVEQARELLTTLDWNDWNDKADAWLAAHPAPEAPVSADEQRMID
jgi:hypothetical protein